MYLAVFRQRRWPSSCQGMVCLPWKPSAGTWRGPPGPNQLPMYCTCHFHPWSLYALVLVRTKSDFNQITPADISFGDDEMRGFVTSVYFSLAGWWYILGSCTNSLQRWRELLVSGLFGLRLFEKSPLKNTKRFLTINLSNNSLFYIRSLMYLENVTCQNNIF